MFERTIVQQILQRLDSDELILLTGARQTGKTTAIQQVKDYAIARGLQSEYITLEDPEYLRLLNEHPDRIWQIVPRPEHAKLYLFMDEIQYLENPTNFLKYHYDQNRSCLKLIVTGSSAFYLDWHFDDSLAGRKKLFVLPTLGFSEFLIFKQKEDLANLVINALAQKPDFSSIPLIKRREILALSEEYMVYGGYPAVVLAPDKLSKQELLFELFSSYLKRDIQESGISQTNEIYHLLRLLAFQIGGELNKNKLAIEIGISRHVLDNLLYALQKSFHIELITPFYRGHPKELKKMPKLYFMDLGMRNTVIKNYDLPQEREYLGRLYENYVYRMLCDATPNPEIQFWRTQSGAEVDFIVDGDQAYEAKWNGNHVNPRKYERFVGQYPSLALQFITHQNSKDYLVL
jgi:hypothetical protein